MIIILIFVAAILVSVIVPSLIDNIVVEREKFSLRQRVGAYALMILIALVIPIFVTGEPLFNSLASIIAVGLALYVDSVSLLGTTIALFIATVLFPASILILIAVGNGVKDPLSMFFKTLPWQFMAPFGCGVLGFFLFNRLKSRFRLNRNMFENITSGDS